LHPSPATFHTSRKHSFQGQQQTSTPPGTHIQQQLWGFSSSPRRGTCVAGAELPCETAELTEECSAGYALLKSKDKKLFGSDAAKDVASVVDSLKLKKFQKFENAVTALNEAAALTDGKVSTMLSTLLEELKDETKASCTLLRAF
jgi:hypothetical protein